MLEKPIIHKRANEVLKQYGSTILGWPKYRLVWAQSRFRYLAGEFRPLYRNLVGWVLEEWRPPQEYGSPVEWESKRTDQGESHLGPFPYDGDYEQCDGIDLLPDITEHQIQFLGKVVSQCANETPEQRKARWKAEEEQKQKEFERILGDIIHDSKPTQREIDAYYADDFRFDKMAQQNPKFSPGIQAIR